MWSLVESLLNNLLYVNLASETIPDTLCITYEQIAYEVTRILAFMEFRKENVSFYLGAKCKGSRFLMWSETSDYVITGSWDPDDNYRYLT